MHIKYLKVKHFFWAALAGLFGINTGCIPCCMYGVPEADYDIHGKVTAPNGDPIPGIEVNMNGGLNDTTDETGNYELSGLWECLSQSLEFEFKDIDSTENGWYRDTIVRMEVDNDEYVGSDGNWYEGKLTKEINMTLQPQK